MGGGSQAKEHPFEYFGASALSAIINYPLWRASAIGQSGFRVTIQGASASSTTTTTTTTTTATSAIRLAAVAQRFPSVAPYVYAFAPPYKGMMATILGMTWARAAIFWGSDRGKEVLQSSFPQLHPSIYTLTPPLFVSIFVQCVNQPIVRASITLQNPESTLPNIRAAVKMIHEKYGLGGLWHGTSAGILKTVPKYCTAIIVKDYMENKLPQNDPQSPTYKTDQLLRSACKSATAGIAGAALTNPLDVIRNEMFKTNKSLMSTVNSLLDEMGWRFILRGMGKNLVAVSVPVASTIFFTDALIQLSSEQ
mmetsp:Transcript_23927/g.35567  ORF Transcript_23927/g.35567 Transcript_23927/m.35567 type:complete len:308 (+) Transcript_23927:262-1185(+)